jgi:predicted acylesterase/phospholipase RssA
MTTPKIFRILSMDGGDGLVTATLLKRISERLKARQGVEGDFLQQVDLFAGASAGGINSLLLAQEDKPDAFIDELNVLWTELLKAMLPLPPSAPDPQTAHEQFGPLGSLVYPAQVMQYVTQIGLSLAGLHNFVNNTTIRNILLQRFGFRKLEELKKTVAVVSFKLDNQAPNPVERQWEPKVFTNVNLKKGPVNADLTEMCIDVALRTSAQPVYFPIFQSIQGDGSGYIDGGYVANNPSMVAIGQAISVINDMSEQQSTRSQQGAAMPPAEPGQFATSAGVAAKDTPDQSKVLVLSLGAGANNMFPGPNFLGPEQLPFFGGNATWGYFLWLLNPVEPFMLLNIFMQANSEEVVFQTRNIVGRDNYYRFAPQGRRSAAPGEAAGKAAGQVLGQYPDPATDALQQSREIDKTLSEDEVDKVVDWLIESGWVEKAA